MCCTAQAIDKYIEYRLKQGHSPSISSQHGILSTFCQIGIYLFILLFSSYEDEKMSGSSVNRSRHLNVYFWICSILWIDPNPMNSWIVVPCKRTLDVVNHYCKYLTAKCMLQLDFAPSLMHNLLKICNIFKPATWCDVIGTEQTKRWVG